MNAPELVLYLGQLMTRLLDTEQFLHLIPVEEMDAEDVVERNALVAWCNQHQKTIALLTHALRTDGDKGMDGAETALVLVSIERFVDDLESQFPLIPGAAGIGLVELQ